MIELPCDDLGGGKEINERITLAPGEDKETRFKAWLAEKTTHPEFCFRHSGTRLVFNGERSGPRQAFENEGCSWMPRKIEPHVFHFKARLDCPACRCRNAFCPPEFHETSFDTFDKSIPARAKLLGLCCEFAEQVNKRRCGVALFLGPPGTGKTRLACNTIRELESGGALYVRQGTVTCELRASYGRKDVYLHRRERNDDDEDGGADEPPTLLEILQASRFLVLDEIGCTALANDERLLLDEVLKHRYDSGKATILISNLPLNAVQEFLGDALYDRIRHHSGGGKYILQFQGESYRRTAGANCLGEVL